MADKYRRNSVDNIPRSIEAKWGSADVLSEGFIPFPKKLLRSLSELFNGNESIQELASLLAIVDFNRANMTQNPTSDYLAFLAGLSQEDFEKSIFRLMENNFLGKGEIGEGDQYVDYSFHPFVQKICGLTSDKKSDDEILGDLG